MTAIFTESEYEIELSAVQGPSGSANAVNYTAQSLTTDQKTQARDNIDAFAKSIGSTANLPLITGSDGVVEAKTFRVLPFTQIAAPSAAPDRAEGAAGAMTGTFYYTVSFVTPFGDTEAYRQAQAITVTSKKVLLSNIPIGPSGVTGRKIWRGDNAGVTYKLLATINDNTTTTYEDNVAFGAVAGGLEVRWNRSGGYITVNDEARFIADPAFTAVGAGQGRTGNGEHNSLFGASAGSELTTGYWNSLFGSGAGEEITTGYENSYFGYLAGNKTTTGWYNSGFGMGSLEKVTTGANNSACGRSAGGLLTSGSSNCFMGYGAGQRMTVSVNSIVIGENSANFIADGTTSFTDSNACIYIGDSCRAFVDGEINAIVIGANAIGAGTNTTVIGNVNTTSSRIFGTLEVRAGAANISASTINGSGVVIGRAQLRSDADGKGYLKVGTGDATYDAVEMAATSAGLCKFNVAIGMTNGNWQMTNDGKHRFSFDGDGSTYIKGHGSNAIYLQNGDGENVVAIGSSTITCNKPITFEDSARFKTGIWHTSAEGSPKNRFSFDGDGATYIRGHGANSIFLQDDDGNAIVALDKSTTSGNTRMQLRLHDGSLQRVTVGASDSGGTGFRVLRVAN